MWGGVGCQTLLYMCDLMVPSQQPIETIPDKQTDWMDWRCTQVLSLVGEEHLEPDVNSLKLALY